MMKDTVKMKNNATMRIPIIDAYREAPAQTTTLPSGGSFIFQAGK
jgi:hypothetical protein